MKVARRFNVAESTVPRFMRRENDIGRFTDHPRPGQLRVTTIPLSRVIALALACFVLDVSSDGHLPNVPSQEKNPTYWNNYSRDRIRASMNFKHNFGVAKNVILFVGDGMDITTITASRILKGQDINAPGEETKLKFEDFPNVALTKTYNLDRQTPDSAGTATAFLCGAKTNYNVLGLDGTAMTNVCEGPEENNNKRLTSMLDWSIDAGKMTGVISTARITHATPAAAYAHAAYRNWEDDAALAFFNATQGCKDIAAQLIDDNYNINVVMGGGRRHFYPNTVPDLEYNTTVNRRADNRSLPDEWTARMNMLGKSHSYVWNKAQFDAIDVHNVEHVLGLFEPSHMQYEVDRMPDNNEPSLTEMTAKAIRILKRDPLGFFLFIESGRIDHAHHDNKAHRALRETLELENAIKIAMEMVNLDETLILATADHSHVFDITGYSYRGNDILGLVDPPTYMPLDNKPMPVLLYSNGPGYNEPRRNLTGVNMADKDFLVPSGVPMLQETHGGEDIATFARGPMGHLIHGTIEQSHIAHVMAYAACIGPYEGNCDYDVRKAIQDNTTNSGSNVIASLTLTLSVFILKIVTVFN